MFADNQEFINLVKNPTYHVKTKYIDIKHHFIHEKLKDKTIDLRYYKTKKNIANIFTKPLARIKHQGFVNNLKLKRLFIQSGSVGNNAI